MQIINGSPERDEKIYNGDMWRLCFGVQRKSHSAPPFGAKVFFTRPCPLVCRLTIYFDGTHHAPKTLILPLLCLLMAMLKLSLDCLTTPRRQHQRQHWEVGGGWCVWVVPGVRCGGGAGEQSNGID